MDDQKFYSVALSDAAKKKVEALPEVEKVEAFKGAARVGGNLVYKVFPADGYRLDDTTRAVESAIGATD